MRSLRSEMISLSAKTGMTETARNYLQSAWCYIRRVSGDDAYEQYLSHRNSAHSADPVLSRQQFYLWRLEQKSRGVNRCC